MKLLVVAIKIIKVVFNKEISYFFENKCKLNIDTKI